MKTPPPLKRGRELNRTTALNYAILNQLATPGLGSLLAGCRLAGAGQLLLAVAGFGLVSAWILRRYLNLYLEWRELPLQPPLAPWVLPAGAALFLAGWGWALATSLAILRQTRKTEDSR
jgi:hypothetical protein